MSQKGLYKIELHYVNQPTKLTNWKLPINVTDFTFNEEHAI